MLAAHAVTTAYYVYRRGQDAEAARQGLERLLRLFDVAPVGRAEWVAALSSGFGDYEDGVGHESAVSARCDGIVTRNGSDFASATVLVYAPGELLAALSSESCQ